MEYKFVFIPRLVLNVLFVPAVSYLLLICCISLLIGFHHHYFFHVPILPFSKLNFKRGSINTKHRSHPPTVLTKKDLRWLALKIWNMEDYSDSHSINNCVMERDTVVNRGWNSKVQLKISESDRILIPGDGDK